MNYHGLSKTLSESPKSWGFGTAGESRASSHMSASLSTKQNVWRANKCAFRIDVICIIQESLKYCFAEAKKMASCYSAASVTISMLDAAKSTEGSWLPSSSPGPSRPQVLDVQASTKRGGSYEQFSPLFPGMGYARATIVTCTSALQSRGHGLGVPRCSVH